ncbi:MAG: hypothetical protein H6822_01100 [Planctomycetaceae bacterium]|nr:hypothetical protein [Planctomycetales bacterium]MCB9920743.1 hypothetical protein [Planctomycetaceae bacterium]
MSSNLSDSQPLSADKSPHVIRLHGPWRYQPLALTELQANGDSIEIGGELPPAGTVKIPGDWTDSLGAEFRGRVLYSRPFGQPTNIDDHQRIDLVLAKLRGNAQIALNGESLGQIESGDESQRFDVTGRLLARNELRVEIDLPRGGPEQGAGGIVGSVQLEIYEAK